MRYVFAVIVLSTTVLSCSKDPVEDHSKRDALTTGTWKLTASKTDYDKDGVYEEDTYAMLDGCLKDNLYTFGPDGTETLDEGPTKCYSNNPQTRTSAWSFSENETRLQFGGVNYQVEELTAATLRVKGTVSYNVIYTINVNSTFTKQ